MSRIDPGLYDFVTDEFLGSAPVPELNAALTKLKAMTGPQLAADSKAKRAVRDGIDRIYRELDARAKGGTSVDLTAAKAAPKAEAPKAEAPKAEAKKKPEAKPAKAEPKPAKAEAKPAAKAEAPQAEAKPVAKVEPAQPPPPAAPTPVAAVELPEGEEFEEEDDSETYGEAGDFD